jgi:hypothetical protein
MIRPINSTASHDATDETGGHQYDRRDRITANVNVFVHSPKTIVSGSFDDF